MERKNPEIMGKVAMNNGLLSIGMYDEGYNESYFLIMKLVDGIWVLDGGNWCSSRLVAGPVRSGTMFPILVATHEGKIIMPEQAMEKSKGFWDMLLDPTDFIGRDSVKIDNPKVQMVYLKAR